MAKYGKFPEAESAEGQWIKFSLEVQIENYPIDWDYVDFRSLSQQIGYVVALSAAGSTVDDDDDISMNVKPAKILIRKLAAEEIDFIDDSTITDFFESQD